MKSDDRKKWLETLSASSAESDKNWSVAFCLSLFLGYLGADRFYLNSIWLGLLKLITVGGVGLWWLIDIGLLLFGKMRDADGGVVKLYGRC